jgi:hypothetical protein
MGERRAFFAERCISIGEVSIKPEGDFSDVSLQPLSHTLCTGDTQRVGMCQERIILPISVPSHKSNME